MIIYVDIDNTICRSYKDENNEWDYSLSTPRNLSVIINLNDDYVGGELYFTSQDMQDIYKIYELKKGDTVIFPSNFLFPHGIMPMVQGTRYSIITWIK